MNQHAAQVIDALGGTSEVAQLFEISTPSVSNWKRDGIPRPRMMLLRATRKRLLSGFDLDAATAPKPALVRKPIGV